MKFSLFTFEGSRAAAKDAAARGALTGRSLRPPYSAASLRVTSQMVSDFQHYRQTVERLNRNVDAASFDNFTSDFKGAYASPNTELLPTKYTTRARSRAIAQNTAHGAGMRRVYADNVVGDNPFELEMNLLKPGPGGKEDMVDDKDLNEAICLAWEIFGQKPNFTVRRNMGRMEALRMVEMERMEAGLCVCRMYDNYPNQFGFAVDFLEEDHLQETFHGLSDRDSKFGAGNPIRGSVEYHAQWNYPVAYWLLKRHPADALSPTSVYESGKNFREQIPADQVILFNNLRVRAEQDLGGTELMATMLPLWRIHQFDKSLTLSSIVSASKPFWIEETRPSGMELPSDEMEMLQSYRDNLANISENGGSGGNQEGVRAPAHVVSPGSREELPAGKILRQADPKFPIEGSDQFRKSNERDIATGTHGSYQQVSSDYQSLGFVAGLLSQQPFQRNMRVRQKSMVEDIRELFRNFLRCAILKGWFDKRGIDLPISRLDEAVEAAVFNGQQWAFVNPLVEAQTLILLNEAGHMSRQDVQDKLPDGKKVAEVIAQLKREKEMSLAAGLTIDGEATEPGINKEGDTPPGTVKPDPAEAGDGGASQPPPKTTPRARSMRKSGEIDATTQALIVQSMAD